MNKFQRHQETSLTPANKLYAVRAIRRRTIGSHKKGTVYPPRLDLAPMNHQAACNWMDACRTADTDYTLMEWPQSVPFPSPPVTCENYRLRRQAASR